MLFKNPKKLLSEAASADLLDPKVSDEVKDVIDELEDVLTNNIEEVDDKDKTTNGMQMAIQAEAVAMLESAVGYGNARYLLKIEDLMAVREAEGEAAAAEAMEEPGQAPTPEEVEAAAPDAGNVIEDIAAKNGVEPEQVAVVITAETVRFLAETALLEAKCGKDKKDCKALGLARKYKKAAEMVKEAGYTLLKI